MEADNKQAWGQPFDLEVIKADAERDYKDQKTRGWKDIAKGALKVAEVIANNFDTSEVEYMARPQAIDTGAKAQCLPIHFLFKKGGKPKFALVVVSMNGVNTPGVAATRTFCKLKGIKYQHVYATGTYADWITGVRNNEPTPPEIVELCQNWLVKRIKEGLK